MTDQWIESNKEKIIHSVQELVRIPSVKDEPLENKPFGEKVNEALEYTLNLCKSLGLEAHNVDGYIGYAQIPSCANLEQVAVLTHVDVVPAGSNWTYPPYEAQIVDGKIYGRGTVDDKGPAIATIYALKALMESGVKLNKNIRLIFGCDEESGWGCVDHYQAKIGMPEVGFSPDADYPIINTEKGIYHTTIITDLKPGAYSLSVTGGTRANVVPDFAQAHIEGNIDSLFKTLMDYDCHGRNIEYQATATTLDIKAFGASAHASTPQIGQNAFWNLFHFLSALQLGGEEQQIIEWAYNSFSDKYHGEGFKGLTLHDEASGALTLNLGVCSIGDFYEPLNKNKAYFTVDIRFPIRYRSQQITDIIQNAIPSSFVCKIGHVQEPHHLEEDHYLVLALKKVYKQYTGKEGRCIAIGGGTYARALKSGVAFGITKENEVSLAHFKDEYIETDYLILNTRMFASAMAELAR